MTDEQHAEHLAVVVQVNQLATFILDLDDLPQHIEIVEERIEQMKQENNHDMVMRSRTVLETLTAFDTFRTTLVWINEQASNKWEDT